MKQKNQKKVCVKSVGNEAEVVCAEMESGKQNPKMLMVTLRAYVIQQKTPKS